MARWIMLGVTILGVALVFTTKSTGVLALGLLLGIVGFFGFVFALAADRVSASARPESSMAAVDDLVALRKRPIAPVSRPSPATAAAGVGKSATDIASADARGDSRPLNPTDQAARRNTN
jgi:hypothetical protein